MIGGARCADCRTHLEIAQWQRNAPVGIQAADLERRLVSRLDAVQASESTASYPRRSNTRGDGSGLVNGLMESHRPSMTEDWTEASIANEGTEGIERY